MMTYRRKKFTSRPAVSSSALSSFSALGVSSISRHGQKLATYRHTFIPHYHQNVFTEITTEPQHITMRNFIGMANYLTFRQEPKFVHFT